MLSNRTGAPGAAPHKTLRRSTRRVTGSRPASSPGVAFSGLLLALRLITGSVSLTELIADRLTSILPGFVSSLLIDRLGFLAKPLLLVSMVGAQIAIVALASLGLGRALSTRPRQVALGSSVPLGGVAFAGDRGISRVQVSTDGGESWQAASLERALSTYSWVLWSYFWQAQQRGASILKVRAVDGKATEQLGRSQQPYPSGATGYHSIQVLVE